MTDNIIVRQKNSQVTFLAIYHITIQQEKWKEYYYFLLFYEPLPMSYTGTLITDG